MAGRKVEVEKGVGAESDSALGIRAQAVGGDRILGRESTASSLIDAIVNCTVEWRLVTKYRMSVVRYPGLGKETGMIGCGGQFSIC